MYCTRKITDNITWVGGSDRRLALFENLFPISRGVAYNSYLIADEKDCSRRHGGLFPLTPVSGKHLPHIRWQKSGLPNCQSRGAGSLRKYRGAYVPFPRDESHRERQKS